MRPLENLLFLKKDMESNGWIIDRFRFEYEKQKYIVLVILYLPDEQKPPYALLKLNFLTLDNFEKQLEVPANTSGLMVDAKTLRNFFGIGYSENLGNILKQFSIILGTFIPKEVLPLEDIAERNAIITVLSRKDSDNPNKLYCFKIRRNPVIYDAVSKKYKQQKRSPFNDNKTKILRKTLYELFNKDDTISFCYSEDPSKDYTDETIVKNWKKENT